MSIEASGTIEVQERHRFDVPRVEQYLRAAVAGFDGPLEVTQFKGGQSNPTYVLKTPAKWYVLRRRPPGVLLQSAHAIDREYRVMRALKGSGVPVPDMLCLCEDESIAGTSFYVMEYVKGRTLWNLALPDMSNEQRAMAFASMCETMAALHSVDVDRLGLSDFGKAGQYMQRQIARWTKQYRASETEKIDAMEELIAWLPDHIPSRESVSIVHGDFRIDNLVFHATEPRVVAVLDWELSTIGDPLADFAYHAMLWDLPTDKLGGLAGLDLGHLGIPSRDQYIARYCERVGQPVPSNAEWDFYVGYNLFRGAAISQGIMRRAMDGSASSKFAHEAGSRARVLADIAWARAQSIK